MADGIFPTLVSATREQNAADNPILVQLSDGSAAITTTSGSLNVNLTNTSIVVTATDLDIRDLSDAQDKVAIGDGTDTLAINPDGSINITDNSGSLTVDGTVELGATTLAALESITVENGSGASAVNIQDGGNSITVDGAVTVSATDLDIRDIDNATDDILVYGFDGTDNQKIKTDAAGELQVDVLTLPLVQVSKDTNPNSSSNPIFVQTVDTGTSNDEVHDYNTATPSADSSSNHDYTVVNTTFVLKQVEVSGSGAFKFEVQVGPVASLVTKAVGFSTGRAGDTKILTFNPPIEVAATGTGTIRIIRTNRENQAVDVYSTIMGNDVV